MFGEGFFDPADPKNEASVDQINAILRNDEVVMNDESTERHDFWHKGRVSSFVKKTNDGCFLSSGTCD